MKVIFIDRLPFEKYLTEKKVTDDNVEDFSDVAIIMSVNTDNDYTYFKKEKDNLIIIKYDSPSLKSSDINKFSESYANYVFEFIKKNRKKRAILLYFENNINGAAAIAMFIYEYITKDYKKFIQDNPSITPDIEVYSLLYREWIKELTSNLILDLNKSDVEDKCSKYAVVITDKHVVRDTEKHGLDGTYFYLPLSEKFNKNDVINAIHKQSHPVFIIEDPIFKIEETASGICKYWLHTVCICQNDPTLYYPTDLLLTGTLYTKFKL